MGKAVFAELVEKCSEKKIQYELNNQNSILIKIPEARKSRSIKISHRFFNIIAKYGIEFLEYKFVPGYNAIWSDSKKIIECEVDYRFNFDHLRTFFIIDKDVDEISFNVQNYEVIISGASADFSFLSMTDINAVPYFMDDRRFLQYYQNTITVKLKSDDLKTTEGAIRLVQNIIESICFEISCRIDEVFSPSMPRKPRVRSRRKAKEISTLKINKKIDKDALAYYWNAEAARMFPLIQYLGYYQVVEHFYSHFSDKELHNKIAIILKDSSFNLHNYKYISKIVDVNRGFFHNNKDHLKLELTINSSLLESDFREWYEYDPANDLEKLEVKSVQESKGKQSVVELNRRKYFSSNHCSTISEKKIDSDSDSELLKQALSRFYDIRCRIVHTDSNMNNIDLNPRTHYDHFVYDIELAKFFAQKVLFATSEDF